MDVAVVVLAAVTAGHGLVRLVRLTIASVGDGNRVLKDGPQAAVVGLADA
jgi:hypothetical protein